MPLTIEQAKAFSIGFSKVGLTDLEITTVIQPLLRNRAKLLIDKAKAKEVAELESRPLDSTPEGSKLPITTRRFLQATVQPQIIKNINESKNTMYITLGISK
jgi:hypothetical protein